MRALPEVCGVDGVGWRIPSAVGAQRVTPCTVLLLIGSWDSTEIQTSARIATAVRDHAATAIRDRRLSVIPSHVLAYAFDIEMHPDPRGLDWWREATKQYRADVTLLITRRTTPGQVRLDLQIARGPGPWGQLLPIEAKNDDAAIDLLGKQISADRSLRRIPDSRRSGRASCPQPQQSISARRRTSDQIARTWSANGVPLRSYRRPAGPTSPIHGEPDTSRPCDRRSPR